eukprot:1141913-Pelagomonas_calceolata.AAC.1
MQSASACTPSGLQEMTDSRRTRGYRSKEGLRSKRLTASLLIKRKDRYGTVWEGYNGNESSAR